MKKIVLSLLFSVAFLIFGYAQTTWIVDPTHSSIQFEVSHLAVSSVTGQFTSYSGIVTSKKMEFEDAKITATIQVPSITTNNLERDKHLKDDDFFNAAEYPEIKFVSNSFKEKGNNMYTIKGDLTIKGVTKPITLNAEFGGIVSINNKQKAGFEARGTINRFDYGLSWDDVLDSGGLIVGEKVDLILNVELVKQ
ncbi:polyisoprenoid-binding protein [Fulvivirga sp. RKSG066]|uniref:YceI family protein n=1 Tax=Fulvivirga aurantia TaxID=2529383 RepID=UPI0012BB6EA6|nr:YceI family protein [Fulvivirga aurantia]MTI19946.1 polyisoprenoid-binding protein [Fulvivirga aurantia]